MTPAEVAAERIMYDVFGPNGGSPRRLAAFARIIAQATRDACEQAAPRVRADERERGMRRAARYAARRHRSQIRYVVGGQLGSDARDSLARVRVGEQLWRAVDRCDRIARGEPAFTTPRAFGRGT